MSFTRRQILGGLAGLVVVGVGAGGASRYWLGKMADEQAGHDYELIASVFAPLFAVDQAATTEIYTLSLHDALPISRWFGWPGSGGCWRRGRFALLVGQDGR